MSQRIPDEMTLPELTLRGVVLGALITVVFTASNVYLGLKVGLTFASSIPAAVISMALLSRLAGANKLENNMVQTQASAAGTLSAIIFVLPGLLMVGYWQGFPFWQTSAICAIGGILGVLYTIPLRRAMVVQSDLPYPEGIAAAEILEVGDRGRDDDKRAHDANEPGARDIALGALVAAAFSLASSGFRVLADSITLWLTAGRTAFQFSTGFSLALVGAGYMIGIVAGMAILIGTLITWGIAVPWLTMMDPASTGPSLTDVAMQHWSEDVRFIGAGVIGVGAIWTLLTLLRPMIEGVQASFGALRKGQGSMTRGPRTDRDLPASILLGLAGILLVALLAVFAYFLHAAAPDMSSGTFWTLALGSVLFAGLFGFIIAAACGYMAGLVGSSSSPISGIGIVAVILVSLMILGFNQLSDGLTMLGDDVASMLPTALALFSTSVIVAVAAISNDNLQDLKTGYLVGATPWRQQVALIIGCLVGALVIPPVLTLLYNAYGFVGALPRADMDASQALGAPQASLMTAIVKGIFAHDLQWSMIIIGLVLGAVMIGIDELLKRRGGVARLPVLAVGLGIYLPASVNMPLIIGATLGWVIQCRLQARAAARGTDPKTSVEQPRRRGVLIASGMIVGESLMGVLIAGIIGFTGSDAPLALVGDGFAGISPWLGLAVFVAVCAGLYRRVMAERQVG